VTLVTFLQIFYNNFANKLHMNELSGYPDRTNGGGSAMYLWKDSRLRLRITRLGSMYVLAMAAAGMLGVYTSNNLLYAVFGLMVGILLVSGWVSRASIKDLVPVRIEEGTLFAKTKGGLRLRLSDGRPSRPRGVAIRLEIADCAAEPIFFGGGKGDASPLACCRVWPNSRGPAIVNCVEISTTHPFGFLEKTWRIHVAMSFLVAPNPAGYEHPQGGSGDFSEPSPDAGASSAAGAKPFVAGESKNRIHWKRTAQKGEPWVRVMEADRPKGILLELNLGEWEPGPAFESELERLSGAILYARLLRQAVSLTVVGQHGRSEVREHRGAWRLLATLEAEKINA
jgi:uncharacterized protein (DUF58 family)